MNRQDQIKLMNKYAEILRHDIFDDDDQWDRLLSQSIEEEKEHDKLRPSGTRRHLSIRDAGVLFTVQFLLQAYLDYTQGKLWQLTDVLHTKPSVIRARALMLEEGYKYSTAMRNHIELTDEKIHFYLDNVKYMELI